MLTGNESAELIVLSLLAEGPSYGYQLTKDATARSEGHLRLTPGVLYPLLRQLENEGLITSSWDAVRAEDSDAGTEGRKRKWYRLSPKGKRRLGQRVAAYESLRKVIDAFVGARPREEGLR